MKRFTTSIRTAISENNLLGALFVSLAMPDICGGLESPQLEVGTRYKAWFQKYLRAKYDPKSHFEYITAVMPQAASIFPAEAIAEMSGPYDKALAFTAEDCYRCRCKMLHQGILEKSGQEKFIFITPLPNKAVLHKNLRNGQLVLQIDVFAEDVCLAVETWEADVCSDKIVQKRMHELLNFTEWYNL